MKTNKFQLKYANMSELSDNESMELNGGGWFVAAIGIALPAAGLAITIINRRNDDASRRGEIDVECYKNTRKTSCFRVPVRPIP
jgi:hypothetical protein